MLSWPPGGLVDLDPLGASLTLTASGPRPQQGSPLPSTALPCIASCVLVWSLECSSQVYSALPGARHPTQSVGGPGRC